MLDILFSAKILRRNILWLDAVGKELTGHCKAAWSRTLESSGAARSEEKYVLVG